MARWHSTDQMLVTRYYSRNTNAVGRCRIRGRARRARSQPNTMLPRPPARTKPPVPHVCCRARRDVTSLPLWVDAPPDRMPRLVLPLSECHQLHHKATRCSNKVPCTVDLCTVYNHLPHQRSIGRLTECDTRALTCIEF